MLQQFVSQLEAGKLRADHQLHIHGFDLLIQNGQRISTNRKVDQERLGQVEYNEIFIGKLPRDLFEDELLPFLRRVKGTIVKIRHMMDISGSNRGFCFVKYASKEEAVRAVRALNETLIRVNCPPVGVKISLDNKCLYFKNLPLRCTSSQLVSSLRAIEIGGIVRAEMVESPQAPNSRRAPLPPIQHFQQFGNPYNYPALPVYPPKPDCSYGYVYFESHDAATKARRLLMPSDMKILGRRISIDWAKSEIPPELLDIQKHKSNVRPRHAPLHMQQLTPFITPNQISSGDFAYWSPRALISY